MIHVRHLKIMVFPIILKYEDITFIRIDSQFVNV